MQLAELLTRIVITLVVVILTLFDVVIYCMYGSGPTISVVIYQFGREWPVATLAFGILLGHLFWPQFRSNVDKEQ